MKLLVPCVICCIIIPTTRGGDPPCDYDPRFAPGGVYDLSRPPIPYPHGRNPSIIPADVVRRFYDAIGLPESGSTDLREPSQAGRPPNVGFQFTPQLVKQELAKHGIRISWERWTLRFADRIEFRWSVSCGLQNTNLFNNGQLFREAWYNLTPDDPSNFNSALPGTTLHGKVLLYLAYNRSAYRPWRNAKTHRTEYTPLPSLTHLVISQAGSGIITPKLKLKDLKEAAPFFYEYLPDYVIERAEWFDINKVASITVIANDVIRGGPDDVYNPHIVEITGQFRFEGAEPGKNFEDYFPADKFPMMHVYEHNTGLSMVSPCRKCDIVVSHRANDSRSHIRFMVDPRYDPDIEPYVERNLEFKAGGNRGRKTSP